MMVGVVDIFLTNLNDGNPILVAGVNLVMFPTN